MTDVGPDQDHARGQSPHTQPMFDIGGGPKPPPTHQQVLLPLQSSGATGPLSFGKPAWQSLRAQWLEGVRLSNAAVSAVRRKGRGRRGSALRTPVGQFALVFVCAAVILTGIAGVFAYQYYRPLVSHDTALAQQGIQHLRNAETSIKSLARNPFNTTAIDTANKEFNAALTIFEQLNHDLGQAPGIALVLPRYGALLHAARDIVPLAVEISQAGILGCAALSIITQRLRNPVDPSSPGISTSDLQLVQQDVAQVVTIFNNAVSQVRALPNADIQADPRIGAALTTFRADLPAAREGIRTLQAVLAVAPAVLGIGKPTSYLIEQLDSTELRPGGGFIGTYGIATVSGARLSAINMTDVDLLDRPFEFAGHTIAFPPNYRWFTLVPSWSLRDSNLDADFPTAAQWAEQIYHTEGGTASPQGVVAITPWLIVNALKITGPVYVNEYNETITADNVVDRIHYHQLRAQEGADYIPDPTGHSSLRKRFTSYLFDHFLEKVRQIAPTKMSEFIQLITSSLRTKDIQIYLNNHDAEQLLQQFHVGATIDAPLTGDSLLTVDANVIANKANDFMTYTATDQVTLDAAGTATHHTTFVYAWPQSQRASQNNYGSTTFYKDYLRIYAPPGAKLGTQSGLTWQGSGQAFGRAVWAGTFTVNYGKSHTITLTWSVPHAATHVGSAWHYDLLFQHQAGIQWWQVHEQITLPSCAADIKSTATPLTGKGLTYSWSASLTEDTTLGLDYHCR